MTDADSLFSIGVLGLLKSKAKGSTEPRSPRPRVAKHVVPQHIQIDSSADDMEDEDLATAIELSRKDTVRSAAISSIDTPGAGSSSLTPASSLIVSDPPSSTVPSPPLLSSSLAPSSIQSFHPSTSLAASSLSNTVDHGTGAERYAQEEARRKAARLRRGM